MKALLIDDEPQILRALQAGLAQNGYKVLIATSGEEGLELAAQDNPDIVILDLAMPRMSGFEVCKQLRARSSVPVIVLSVRQGEDDKIRALDGGADDFLTKPFGLRELLARMRAVLRRVGPDEQQEPPFSCKDLYIDFARRLVRLRDQEIHLTPKEFDLLSFMALNADRVLTHRQLLSKVWGPEYTDDHHTLRVHVANLRTKIERQPERPQFIHTETRIGYRFRTD